jgi:hypothetical protein
MKFYLKKNYKKIKGDSSYDINYLNNCLSQKELQILIKRKWLVKSKLFCFCLDCLIQKKKFVWNHKNIDLNILLDKYKKVIYNIISN